MLGNRVGKTLVLEMDDFDPAQTKASQLQHPECASTIRQTTLSKDGNVLIYICDDSTIWRWDRQSS